MPRTTIAVLFSCFSIVLCKPVGAESVSLAFASLPGAQGWTFEKTSTGNHANDTETGVFSVSSNTLTMNTIGDGFAAPSAVGYARLGVVDPTLPWTLEWTMRIVDYESVGVNDSGGFVAVYSGGYRVSVGISDVAVEVDNGVGFLRALRNNTAFQDFRLEFTPDAGTGTFDLFIDNALVLSSVGRPLTEPNRLRFGDQTGGANARWEMTRYVFRQDPPLANGDIVVAHDVNTLSSSQAGANEERFAVNVATYLTGGTTGNLLLFESGTDTFRNFAPGVVTALTDAGFTVTVTGDYTTPFAAFDAIFVAQEFPEVQFLDNQALINFVNTGGKVYLAGGVGSPAPPPPDAGAAIEAAGWATFLNHFGLGFSDPYNTLFNVNITSAHPLFTGVTSLKCGIGNPIVDLGTNPHAQIVQSAAGGGVYAVVIADRPDPPRMPAFVKEIVDGPDEDGDGLIDRVIRVGQSSSTVIAFTITFRQPDLAAPALILDTIPAEWDVEGCVTGNPADLVLVFPAGRSGRSATKIQWHPTDNDSTLTCTLRTRPRGNSGRVKYAPTSCGALRVNDGARAVDSSNEAPLLDQDGNPLVSNTLCLAAVDDFNGDGVIDTTGNGDEDGDGLSDYAEACEIGTDPCNPDTDGDGIPDGTDADPLHGNSDDA